MTDLNTEWSPEDIGISIEKKLNLINHGKQQQQQQPNHLQCGKFHLNQKGLKVLSNVFLEEISNIFNRQYIDKTHAGCKSNVWVENAKRIDAKPTLLSIYEFLVNQVKNNINILLISETKFYDSCLLGNLKIDGFSEPYSLDCDSIIGGILWHVKILEDIPSNLLEVKTKNLCNDRCLIISAQ